MKKLIITATCLASAFALVSCSQGPADALEGMKNCQEQNDLEGAKKFYTSGTVTAMEEMEKLAPESGEDKSKSGDNISKDAEWEVVSEEVSGDTAKVKVKFTKHPVEQMNGMEYTFNLKKEDGAWKIDMEKEMRQTLKILKMSKKMGKSGSMDFMKQMKNFMQ